MLVYEKEWDMAEQIKEDLYTIGEKFKEMIKDIDYEDADDGPLFMIKKQLEDIYNLARMQEEISDYFEEIVYENNSDEDREREFNSVEGKYKRLPEERKLGVAKIVSILQHQSMVDIVSIHKYNLKQEDFDTFAEIFNISWVNQSHGDWVWISFQKDGKNLDLDGLREAGVPYYEDEDKEKESCSDSEVEVVETEEIKEEDEYGYVTPDGIFIGSAWGTHEGSALDIVKEKKLTDRYHSYQDEVHKFAPARDFLINELKYILIHNPSRLGRTQVQIGPQNSLTKAQKDFLYDYFIKRDENVRAEYYLNLD